ncbi:MAG: filamentous hemagglutinin N-terminal domain-containing protein, partial [Polynucleobacter sp.]
FISQFLPSKFSEKNTQKTALIFPEFLTHSFTETCSKISTTFSQILSAIFSTLFSVSISIFEICKKQIFSIADKFFSSKLSTRHLTTFLAASIFTFALVPAHAQKVNPAALPTGGKVIAGAAKITQSGLVMNINQTSQKAVVNWDSFNVGSQATVNFNQPNANSVTLNQVTGATRSVINGAINANGTVILQNPNGVSFGKGAEVNAGAVVASTMQINAQDFMDGKNTYTGNGTGKIVNKGKITATGADGYIALLAPEVQNQGYLIAVKGGANSTIAIASGKTVSLSFSGNQLISVSVDEGVYNALVSNKRVVEVNGGYIVIAAGAANQLMASTIKNTGRISASAMVDNGGVIELVASKVTQAGTVSANGGVQVADNSVPASQATPVAPVVTNSAANGGQVNIVGNSITLGANSKTTAFGAANGGQVNVGTSGVTSTLNADGSRSNVAAANLAQTVEVGQGAVVDTSSINRGNGGQIRIWSSIQTTIAGALKSVGGILGGNGGVIDTSSTGLVSILQSASINVSATLGKVGSWFIDVNSINIDSGAAAVVSNTLANGNVFLNSKQNLTVASNVVIAPNSSNATILSLTSAGILTNNGAINATQNGALLL